MTIGTIPINVEYIIEEKFPFSISEKTKCKRKLAKLMVSTILSIYTSIFQSPTSYFYELKQEIHNELKKRWNKSNYTET
jgi:inorganic pyrophosphatase/exopolyphosphatase